MNVEQTCNDINKNIVGGLLNVVEPPLLNNPVLNNTAPVVSKTTYFIFGYELSLLKIFIIVVILAVILYFVYVYFFKSKSSEIVNVEKVNTEEN